ANAPLATSAKRSPQWLAVPLEPVTITTTPANAATLATTALGDGRSPSHTQASRPAKNGTVAPMRVTLATVVSFSAGIYATIVMAYASVTITSGHPIALTAWKTPRRCVHTRYTRMKNAPKIPRQNRMVQALASIRRMKKPVVLNASVDTVTRSTPSRCAEEKSHILRVTPALVRRWTVPRVPTTPEAPGPR